MANEFRDTGRLDAQALRGGGPAQTVAESAFFGGSDPGPIEPLGIPSEEAFGTPQVLTGGAVQILPFGIPSEEAFGTPTVEVAMLPIEPSGIPSEEAFGTPTVVVGRIEIYPSGIPSEEAFGTPTFVNAIHPTGIPSGEQFGRPQMFVGSIAIVRPPSYALTDPYPSTARWSFYLAYSSILRVGTPNPPPTIAELVNAKDIRLELFLNRPGSLTLSTLLDDESAQYIVPIKTALLAVRDGKVRWAGPVWTVDRDIPSGRVNVNAVGWFDLLERRQIRQSVARPVETDDVRVAALFDVINSQVDSSGRPQPAPLVYGGHAGSTQERSSDTWGRGNPAGSILTTLLEIENGFDIRVDPVTRVLTTHREQLIGQLRGWGADRPNTVFAYGLGPDNLTNFRQHIDASTLANVINAVPDAGPAQPADELFSLEQYGTFEADFPMTGAGIGPDILMAGAVAEVYFRSQPRVTYDLSPLPWTPGSSVPRIFDDYDIGDIIRFAAKRSWFQVPENTDSGRAQTARVFGATIGVNENGEERVETLQVAAIGVAPIESLASDAVITPPPPPLPPRTDGVEGGVF